MNDEILLRLIKDAGNKLERVHFPVETPHLLPVYDALLEAVQANHPENAFLRVLRPLSGESKNGTTPEELKVLLGQLRIVLESLIAEQQNDAMNDESGGTIPMNRSLAPMNTPSQ